MFYRVKCLTNLFVPTPPGARFVYRVSNAAGSAWTQQLNVLGNVKPLAGAGMVFTAIEVVNPQNMAVNLGRSTDSAFIELDQSTLVENLSFQRAPPGTTWTNFNYHGKYNMVRTVEAIETVSVPAGTFGECYKFHRWVESDPTRHLYEWFKPGLGLVKTVDYWVGAAENPPVVYELQSWDSPTPEVMDIGSRKPR
jgi:hypothetical protein